MLLGNTNFNAKKYIKTSLYSRDWNKYNAYLRNNRTIFEKDNKVFIRNLKW